MGWLLSSGFLLENPLGRKTRKRRSLEILFCQIFLSEFKPAFKNSQLKMQVLILLLIARVLFLGVTVLGQPGFEFRNNPPREECIQNCISHCEQMNNIYMICGPFCADDVYLSCSHRVLSNLMNCKSDCSSQCR